MARVLTTGWELGHPGEDWTPYEADDAVNPNAMRTQTSPARSGGRSLRVSMSTHDMVYATVKIPSTNEFWLRMAFRLAMNVTQPFNTSFLEWSGPQMGNAEIGSLRLNGETLGLAVHLSDASQANSTEFIAGSISAHRWHLIELHWRTGTVDQFTPLEDRGELELKVDGVTTVLTPEVDTASGTVGEIDRIRFGWDRHTGVFPSFAYMFYDDCAVNDPSGDNDNGWVGDGHVTLLRPKGPGYITQFGGMTVDTLPVVEADTCSQDGTEDAFYIASPGSFGWPTAGYEIEYDNDGISRVITGYTGTSPRRFTFDPPLSWMDGGASTPPGGTTGPPPITLSGKPVKQFGLKSAHDENWELVRTVPVNRSYFVETDQIGDKDMYELQDLADVGIPDNAVIMRLDVVTMAYTKAVGSDSIMGVVRVGGVDYSSPSDAQMLGPAFKVHRFEFLQNPGTLADWESADLDALEAGMSAEIVIV